MSKNLWINKEVMRLSKTVTEVWMKTFRLCGGIMGISIVGTYFWWIFENFVGFFGDLVCEAAVLDGFQAFTHEWRLTTTSTHRKLNLKSILRFVPFVALVSVDSGLVLAEHIFIEKLFDSHTNSMKIQMQQKSQPHFQQMHSKSIKCDTSNWNPTKTTQ